MFRVFYVFLNFAALDGCNGIFHRAVAERNGAHRFGAATDRVFMQVDFAFQALGRDIDLLVCRTG